MKQEAGGGGVLRSIPARLWVALGLIAAVVVFIVQNRDVTKIQVLFVAVTSPLWVTLAFSVAAGVLIGLLLGRRSRQSAQ